MSGQITFNPGVTTNAQDTFATGWDGYIQGVAMPDPSIRNQLAGGVLASGQTLPMWGGVGISEMVPASPQSANGTLGGAIKRATALSGATGLTGFSVFDQNHSAINTPQSEVPLVAIGMGLMFYRLGSGARISVKCDPALVSLLNGVINAQVSWDFTNQMLIPYDSTPGALPVSVLDIQVGNSMTVTYNSGTGFATWDRAGTAALILI